MIAPDTYKTIRIEKRENGVALATLNRPEKRNAVDDDALMDRTLELADRLAAGPTLAISASKTAVNQYMKLVSNVVLPLSLKLEEWTMNTEDFREAVVAFAEKREPKYEGR